MALLMIHIPFACYLFPWEGNFNNEVFGGKAEDEAAQEGMPAAGYILLYACPWQDDGEEREANNTIEAFKGGQIKKKQSSAANRFHSFQNSSQEQ
jgi:hypothetical protein